MADTERSAHSCSVFSDLFFGGSCDSVVHHILTADKQLSEQNDSSVLQRREKLQEVSGRGP